MDPGNGLGRELNLWTFFRPHQSGAWNWYRPYFENYTVDASILNLTAFGLFELQRLSRRNSIPTFRGGVRFCWFNHWSISVPDLFRNTNRFKLM
jgi:hypothetical protein